MKHYHTDLFYMNVSIVNWQLIHRHVRDSMNEALAWSVASVVRPIVGTASTVYAFVVILCSEWPEACLPHVWPLRVLEISADNGFISVVLMFSNPYHLFDLLGNNSSSFFSLLTWNLSCLIDLHCLFICRCFLWKYFWSFHETIQVDGLRIRSRIDLIR